MRKILSTTNNCINVALDRFNIVSIFDNEVDVVIFNESIDTELEDLAKSKGIKTFGGRRLDKLNQYFLLERLGINTPKVFYNVHTNKPIQTIDEFNAFVDVDTFVVKPPLGARGIGVKVITRKDWKDCIMDNKHTYSVFSDEFMKLNGDEITPLPLKKEDINNLRHKDESISRDYIEYGFKNFIIQEEIKVKREFRIIYFRNNTFLSYERVKQEDQFCGNLSHGTDPKVLSESEIDEIVKPNIGKFKTILKETNYPWISIDLYIDENDEFGIFEFQMEYAYEGFDYKLVKDTMSGCLSHLIEEK
jgi:hypothetical protein